MKKGKKERKEKKRKKRRRDNPPLRKTKKKDSHFAGRPLGCAKSQRGNVLRLLLGSCGSCSGVGVFLCETFDAACGIEKLLFAREKRMAIGANFDAQHIAFDRRARGESVPAGAMYCNGVIIGMNTGLHESPFCRGRSAPLLLWQGLQWRR
jgi:hypothetical protein